MDKVSAYNQLLTDIRVHTCSLQATRIQAVPGVGNIDSPVVFIGEAPGKNEDEQGRPFIGAAGKLLEEALVTIGWSRDDVYITNVVKCRPPENRDPTPAEVAEHHSLLARELELIKPKIVVLLGRHALHWFLPELQISKARGTAKRKNGQLYYPTYHPAAALYNGSLKETFISDIGKIPLILSKLDESTTRSQAPAEQSSLFTR